MSRICQGLLSLVGRILLCTIFFMSAAGNKVPVDVNRDLDRVVTKLVSHVGRTFSLL